MKAIVVGAGGATRELLRRLAEVWDVTVIESSDQRLSTLRAIQGVHIHSGDGSSRLVLERAGLADVEAVVAATNDDDANLEICRIAKQAGVLRIAAVAADPERLPSYREMGVTAFSPDTLVARRIELSLEHRRIASMAFADGKAEAIEFRLGTDSPVCGKALAEFRAPHWIIGAVLRGDQVIIPHGDTVLMAGDRVTVVGVGAHFSEIVRTFTEGEARFPLNFGKRVAVAVSQEEDLVGPVTEAANLVRNSAAYSLLLIHRDPALIRDEEMAVQTLALLERARTATAGVELHLHPVPLSAERSLPEICRSESVGIVVTRGPEGAGLLRLMRARRSVQLARRLRVPVLISRGSQPYRRILAPARQTRAGLAAGRAGIDLARYAKAELTGIAVVDPVFTAGKEAVLEVRKSISWLRQEAAMQHVHVHGRIERGNPVRCIMDAAHSTDLLILGVGQRVSFHSSPSIATHIAFRFPKSVLLVPVRE